MIRNRRVRHVASVALVLLGGALLWLAPSANYGLLAFALGVVLELAGTLIERRNPP